MPAGVSAHAELGDRVQAIGERVSAAPLLTVDDVTVQFRGIIALSGVSIEVPEGSVFGLIGPNGAGKTTLLNCLSRLYSYQAGDISFQGQSITRLPPHAMPRLGIARTFQNVAVFRSMSVIDNVVEGAHCRSRAGFVASALRLPWVSAEEQRLRDRADQLIRYLDLGAVAHRSVGELTFAVRKRVEIGRALAADPKLLLLDEPAAGLNEVEIRELRNLIVDIRDRLHVTVLLVEHHMGLVMNTSDRIAVLNFGKKIAEGSPGEIQEDPHVIAAYLGRKSHD